MKNILQNKAKTNLVVDITNFSVFLILNEVKVTGSTIHEWLGVTFGLIIIIHILLHWKWLMQMTKQLMGRINAESRLNYSVDILIFIGFTTILFSGLMISKRLLPSFGIRIVQNHFWRNMHELSTDITLILTALHFALHWQWIVNCFKRFIISPFKNRKVEKEVPTIPVFRTIQSNVSNLSSILQVSYRFFIIIALAGFISFGWYAVSFAFSAKQDNPTFQQKFEQNQAFNPKLEVDKNAKQFDPNQKKNFNRRGRPNKIVFFIIDVLKNLLIFCFASFVVTKIGNRIRR